MEANRLPRLKGLLNVRPIAIGKLSRELPEQNFTFLLLGAWAVAALQLVLGSWLRGFDPGDTDSAMRLVQVRDWLAGQGWFDIHFSRVNPPEGYDSHWSRLVDAGLGGLYILFRQAFDSSTAEFMMREIWPLVWLLPAMLGVSLIARRLSGNEATGPALLLSVLALPGFQNFTPGNIDHHNVQISIALLTLAAVVWSDRKPGAAWVAGALTGFGFGIGFECAPILALCGFALAVRFVIASEGGTPLRFYGIAVAVSAMVAFLLSIAPNHWFRTACDAISINTAIPVATGGLLLAIGATVSSNRGPACRFSAVAIATAAAVSIFCCLDPRCINGPFAAVDPAVKSFWIGRVVEMKSAIRYISDDPKSGLFIASFPAIGLLATLFLACRRPRWDFAFATVSVTLLAADLFASLAVKGFPYAIWMTIPVMAALATSLVQCFGLAGPIYGAIVTCIMSPVAVFALSWGIVSSLGAGSHVTLGSAAPNCSDPANYKGLAQLTPGLVVNEIDLGPFLIAFTSHSALVAPYHRLSNAIILAHTIFSLPPDEAQKIVSHTNARYLMICRASLSTVDPLVKTSLLTQLQEGRVPCWLKRIQIQANNPIMFFTIQNSCAGSGV